MSRHIELGVVKIKHDRVVFKIVEQTHRESEFCQQFNSNTFEASNGVILKSSMFPNMIGNLKLFCRGNDYEKDDTELTCSIIDYVMLCEAITEYNATNGTGYEKWPKYGNFYFVVTENGSTDRYYFDESEFDFTMKEIGNFFRTEDEAKAAAEEFKTMLKKISER